MPVHSMVFVICLVPNEFVELNGLSDCYSFVIEVVREHCDASYKCHVFSQYCYLFGRDFPSFEQIRQSEVCLCIFVYRMLIIVCFYQVFCECLSCATVVIKPVQELL